MTRAAIFRSNAKWLQRAYERDRAARAAEIGRPYKKQKWRRKPTPPPGAIPLADEENG